MEVGMSLNPLIGLSLSPSSTFCREDTLFPCKDRRQQQLQQKRRGLMVVEAKGKRGGRMMSRQFQRQPPPPLPKLEDDGNPKFVIFIRAASVSSFFWVFFWNFGIWVLSTLWFVDCLDVKDLIFLFLLLFNWRILMLVTSPLFHCCGHY